MSHEKFRNKNVYILNFRKVSSTNQTKPSQSTAKRVRTGRAMRGRCTGCDALTSTDLLYLRDALRGRCTGCDARTSTDWLHLRDALRGVVASAGSAMLLSEKDIGVQIWRYWVRVRGSREAGF